MSDIKIRFDQIKKDRIKKESYSIIRTLGKGSFGTTYLVNKTDEPLEKHYVLKSLQLKETQFSDIYSEISILERIANATCRPDILCYKEYFIDIENKTVNIVTDAFENAITLKKYIQNLLINPEYIPHKSLLQIMYNLLKPIYHISKLGIAHLDIKPDNILINPDTLDIQIIDFGVSCYKKCKPSGTMAFASPEILRDILKVREISLNESLKSDVFSLGVVFYLLANLQLPYRVKGPNPYKIQESYNIIATTSTGTGTGTNKEDEDQGLASAFLEMPNLSGIRLGDQLVSRHDLEEFYTKKSNRIMSMYNNNESKTDRDINELIESMLRLDIKEKNGRPSIRRVLAKIKKIIFEYNSIGSLGSRRSKPISVDTTLEIYNPINITPETPNSNVSNIFYK